MTVFVDASALVAMISDEPEALALKQTLEAYQGRLTSALALWKAASAIARQLDSEIGLALSEVERFCAMLRVISVPIGGSEASEALAAHARYGKGTGHPARLNMGDCFADACARTNGAKLLYKGDDFSHTGLR